jgi:hypothetical protein
MRKLTYWMSLNLFSILLNGRPTTRQSLPPFSIVLTSTYMFYFILMCHLFIGFNLFIYFICCFSVYTVLYIYCKISFCLVQHHSVFYLFVWLFVFEPHNTSGKYSGIRNIYFVYGVSDWKFRCIGHIIYMCFLVFIYLTCIPNCRVDIM